MPPPGWASASSACCARTPDATAYPARHNPTDGGPRGGTRPYRPAAIDRGRALLATPARDGRPRGGGRRSAAAPDGGGAAGRGPRPDRGRARASARRCWPEPSRARSASSFARIQFTPDLLPSDVTGASMLEGRRASASCPARSSPRCCWPTRSTAPRRAPSRRCSRPWRSARSRSRARRGRCPTRSWCWRPRTRSSSRAPSRCPRRSSTASCCASGSATPSQADERRIAAPLPTPRQPLDARAAGRRRRAAAGAARRGARGPRQPTRSSDYIVALVRATRERTRMSSWAPARAPAWRCTAPPRRWALLDGRDFVLPDDVKAVAPGVLGHRVMLDVDRAAARRDRRGGDRRAGGPGGRRPRRERHRAPPKRAPDDARAGPSASCWPSSARCSARRGWSSSAC